MKSVSEWHTVNLYVNLVNPLRARKRAFCGSQYLTLTELATAGCIMDWVDVTSDLTFWPLARVLQVLKWKKLVCKGNIVYSPCYHTLEAGRHVMLKGKIKGGGEPSQPKMEPARTIRARTRPRQNRTKTELGQASTWFTSTGPSQTGPSRNQAEPKSGWAKIRPSLNWANLEPAPGKRSFAWWTRLSSGMCSIAQRTGPGQAEKACIFLNPPGSGFYRGCQVVLALHTRLAGR